MASVWVYENMWPMCSEPDTVGGGVSMAKTRRARRGPVESVGARLLPPGRPFGLETLEGGLVGDLRRPRRLELGRVHFGGQR